MKTPKCPNINESFSVRQQEQQKTIMYLVLIFVIVFYMYYFFTKFENVTIKINNNNLLKATGEFSENLLSDDKGNIYKISNNLLILYFTAAETLNKLESGKSYIVSGYGKRIPLLGLYPQITKLNTMEYHSINMFN